jgi:hypothetical protein
MRWQAPRQQQRWGSDTEQFAGDHLKLHIQEQLRGSAGCSSGALDRRIPDTYFTVWQVSLFELAYSESLTKKYPGLPACHSERGRSCNSDHAQHSLDDPRDSNFIRLRRLPLFQDETPTGVN